MSAPETPLSETASPEEPTPDLPPDVPPEAAAFLREMGYLQPDRLKVGGVAPRLLLNRLNPISAADATVEVGSPDALLPTVLIFGSYT